MQPPVLLCYNLANDKAAKIRLLAMKLQIRIRTVTPEEYAKPLEMLCGYVDAAESLPVQQVFTDEMLVLANFPQPTLIAFLNGFRQGKIPTVSLKAILTDTNQHWDSVTLHKELVLEHQAMAAARQPAHPQPDA